MKKNLFTILLASLVLCSPVRAGEGDLTEKTYLPLVWRNPKPLPNPWPYNVKAEDIVLRPSEVPPGFQLDEDSGPRECTEPCADSFSALYGNSDLLTGTPVVSSNVDVYRTPDDAHRQLNIAAWVYGYLLGVPAPGPSLGDESFTAYIQIEPEKEGDSPLGIFAVVFRKGNLLVITLDGGLAEYVQLDLAANSARIVHNRINGLPAMTSLTTPRMPITDLSAAAYERRLQAVVEAVPDWVAEEILSAGERIGDDRAVLWRSDN